MLNSFAWHKIPVCTGFDGISDLVLNFQRKVACIYNMSRGNIKCCVVCSTFSSIFTIIKSSLAINSHHPTFTIIEHHPQLSSTMAKPAKHQQSSTTTIFLCRHGAFWMLDPTRHIRTGLPLHTFAFGLVDSLLALMLWWLFADTFCRSVGNCTADVWMRIRTVHVHRITSHN